MRYREEHVIRKKPRNIEFTPPYWWILSFTHREKSPYYSP